MNEPNIVKENSSSVFMHFVSFVYNKITSLQQGGYFVFGRITAVRFPPQSSPAGNQTF